MNFVKEYIHNVIIVVFVLFVLSLLGYNLAKTNNNVECIDGDTFKVGQNYYRLSYIDTPEKDESTYITSSKFTCNYLKKEDFKLEYKGKDKYNRELVVVYSNNGKSLNEQLIRQCLAEPFYSDTTDWIERLYNNCKIY